MHLKREPSGVGSFSTSKLMLADDFFSKYALHPLTRLRQGQQFIIIKLRQLRINNVVG